MLSTRPSKSSLSQKRAAQQPFLFGALTTFVAVLVGCNGSEPEPASTGLVSEQAASATTTRSGAAIVSQYCAVCHERGLYNAPKLTDPVAWQPRLAAGQEALWQAVWQGKLAMPARGNCHDCSEAELRAALEHMLTTVAAVPQAAVAE